MRLIKETTRIDFLSQTRRRVAVAISVILVIVSLGSLATRGLEFGIDFTGGVLLEVGYPEAADLDGIRTDLANAGLNIEDLLNKSVGDLAYTIVDVNAEPSPEVLEEIRSIDGVLRLRNLGKPVT